MLTPLKTLDDLAVPHEIQRPGKNSLYFSMGEVNDILRSYDGIAPLLFITTELGGASAYLAASGRAGIICNMRVGADPSVDYAPEAPIAAVRRPENAAKFAAQLFAGTNPTYRQCLINANEGKVAKLVAKDAEFQRAYAAQQGR